MKTIVVGLIGCLGVCGTAPALAQDVKAVVGATVIGAGGAPIPDAVIIIEGSRIARVGPRATTSVPSNAEVIDARGKFVTPGLADMHNHVRTGSTRPQQNFRMNLSALLGFGVTTVFNPAASAMVFADLKTATAPDAAPFPRVFGTGPMITVKGGSLGDNDGGPTPETPADARAAVTQLKAIGVDAIKISFDDASWASTRRVPLMRTDVLDAVVSDAHREGLKVFAHAPLLEQARAVLRAGADGLLHGIIDQPVDQAFIDLMIRNRAVYVPTMSLYEDVGDVVAWAQRQVAYDERQVLSPIAAAFASPIAAKLLESLLDNMAFTKARLPTQRANLKRVFDAGVPVVMGTDAGFPGVVMGVSSQLELALMVEAGLPPASVLQAATINAARMIGRDKEWGSVEPGKAADLLILDANPLEDIRNVRRIYRVVRGGAVHEPAQLLSAVRFTAPPRPPQ